MSLFNWIRRCSAARPRSGAALRSIGPFAGQYTPFQVRLLARLASIVLLLGAAAAAHAQSMFTHKIPIRLPKGANGMHPELAFVYNPGSGNGILGMGWQLTGLPRITRVNAGSGINYIGTDSYAHSELGLLVEQADGTYRTKSESFVKFVPAGSCGDGPCSWTAYYPSVATGLRGSPFHRFHRGPGSHDGGQELARALGRTDARSVSG